MIRDPWRIELLTDIRDYGSSEWLESSMESTLGRQFAIWSLNLWRFSLLVNGRRLLKKVSWLLIFVIRENETFISVICDPQVFPLVNRAIDPPLRPSINCLYEWDRLRCVFCTFSTENLSTWTSVLSCARENVPDRTHIISLCLRLIKVWLHIKSLAENMWIQQK